MPPPPYILRGKEMKRMIALLIVGLLLCLTAASCVSANDEETTPRNHGPFYFGTKPLERYEQPGFVCGYYTEIEWIGSSTGVRALYSPHLLFGWNFGYRSRGPPIPIPWFFQIGAFVSKVKFLSFDLTFIGFFSGIEPGFVCGFVDGMCYFTYT